jgi:hypothetical protein
MMKEVPQAVIEFLVETIPGGVLRIYGHLAQLEYPISDMKSLLASAPGDEEEARLVRAVWAEVFTVHDFPLGSPQGALEKFHEALPTPSTALRRTAVGRWKPPFEFTEGVDPGAVIDWFNCYSDCESKFRRESIAAGDNLRAHLIAFLKMLQCQRDCASRPPGGLRLPL